MEKKTPMIKQVKIVAALCGGIIVWILVLSGADNYLSRIDMPRWLEIVMNVLTFSFSIAAGFAFFGYFVIKNNSSKD